MKNLIKHIESYIPTHLAEKYDNVGLLVGDLDMVVKRVYLCLDPTMEVIEDAIKKKADLIIAHHPYGLDGFKQVTTETNIGRKIIKLISNQVGLYVAHTNLDRTSGTINEIIFNKLDLKESEIFIKNDYLHLFKLVVFVPNSHVDYVRVAMGDAGAGQIGLYSHCAFQHSGQGMFKPLQGSNPATCSIGTLERVDEVRLEVVVEASKVQQVIQAMKKAHPYEEVAYDLFQSLAKTEERGYGLIGKTAEPIPFENFINQVKNKLELKHLQYVGDLDAMVQNVVICSGSGMDFLDQFIATGADVFITGDIKYHYATAAKDQGVHLIDASHYGTERFVVTVFKDLLSGLELELIIDQISNNPIQIL